MVCEDPTGSYNQVQFQNTHMSPEEYLHAVWRTLILNCNLYVRTWHVFKNTWSGNRSFNFVLIFVLTEYGVRVWFTKISIVTIMNFFFLLCHTVFHSLSVKYWLQIVSTTLLEGFQQPITQLFLCTTLAMERITVFRETLGRGRTTPIGWKPHWGSLAEPSRLEIQTPNWYHVCQVGRHEVAMRTNMNGA